LKLAPSRRLHDGVAAAAGQLGAHMADHAEVGRRELELFGHVLVKWMQRATTCRAGVSRWQVQYLVAWQVIRQWFAWRAPARR
jgi:hypothetical protein